MLQYIWYINVQTISKQLKQVTKISIYQNKLGKIWKNRDKHVDKALVASLINSQFGVKMGVT